MAHSDTSNYIICNRRKGRQRKHVAVCGSCRRQPSCDAFRMHQQKNPRKNAEVPLTRQDKPFRDKDLINDVLRELMEIRLILADYPHKKRSGGITKTEDALNHENFFNFLRNELYYLKSLF